MDCLQGRNDLVLRDMRRCTGELPWEGVGEFLHSRMAFHTSAPSLLALVVIGFIIFIADSAFPFDFV